MSLSAYEIRMPSSTDAYAELSFATRGEIADHLARTALALIANKANPRLLDLGCGTGDLAVRAAVQRGDLEATAIDVSAANIAVARSASYKSGVGERVRTICTDYLMWDGGLFDLIVSDSVLHLLPIETAVLATRLATNLQPGGVLIATMPVRSIGNALRIALRRGWRATPVAFDKYALTLAVQLYPSFQEKFLAERIPYLRVLPCRLHDANLDRLFAAAGLLKILDRTWESPGLAKLRHRLFAWQRATAQ